MKDREQFSIRNLRSKYFCVFCSTKYCKMKRISHLATSVICLQLHIPSKSIFSLFHINSVYLSWFYDSFLLLLFFFVSFFFLPLFSFWVTLTFCSLFYRFFFLLYRFRVRFNLNLQPLFNLRNASVFFFSSLNSCLILTAIIFHFFKKFCSLLTNLFQEIRVGTLWILA